MKLKGNDKPRLPNLASPFAKEQKLKQLTYYVNLDGTLAYYNVHGNINDIGDPIPNIKEKVLQWIKEGVIIKIFTARAYCEKNKSFVRKWLMLNGFPPTIEITNIKGIDCDLIFDDKAREVIMNTGDIIDRTGKL